MYALWFTLKETKKWGTEKDSEVSQVGRASGTWPRGPRGRLSRWDEGEREVMFSYSFISVVLTGEQLGIRPGKQTEGTGKNGALYATVEC